VEMIVGTKYFGKGIDKSVRIFEGEDVVHVAPLEELTLPNLGSLAQYGHSVTEVVVGFSGVTNVDFFSRIPNVQKVRMLTSSIQNIEGLRCLDNIRILQLDRPRYKMNILGELKSLENLYLDDWRGGAQSIFSLEKLSAFGVQKFPYIDLQPLRNWHVLESLWLNAGKLETLDGIPKSLLTLKLNQLRRLTSIKSIAGCRQLKDFSLNGCRKINSLSGIQTCQNLSNLSISKVGTIHSLEPLREIPNLSFVYIADGVNVSVQEKDVFHNHMNLQRLIISRKLGIDVDALRFRLPETEIILAT